MSDSSSEYQVISPAVSDSDNNSLSAGSETEDSPIISPDSIAEHRDPPDFSSLFQDRPYQSDRKGPEQGDEARGRGRVIHPVYVAPSRPHTPAPPAAQPDPESLAIVQPHDDGGEATSLAHYRHLNNIPTGRTRVSAANPVSADDIHPRSRAITPLPPTPTNDQRS